MALKVKANEKLLKFDKESAGKYCYAMKACWFAILLVFQGREGEISRINRRIGGKNVKKKERDLYFCAYSIRRFQISSYFCCHYITYKLIELW